MFSSPTPSNSTPLQSGRNPLDKQKKLPGSTFCSPGPGSPQNSGRRACGPENCPINSGSQSTRSWAATLKINFMSNSTLTSCTPTVSLAQRVQSSYWMTVIKMKVAPPDSAHKQRQQSPYTVIIYYGCYRWKLNVPITLPGMKVQRKKRFAKIATKKPPQNQKNPKPNKKTPNQLKLMHISALM